MLKRYGYTKLTENLDIINNRDVFLKKYIELIDNISFENNSRIWWASEFASKNRFTTNLPELLFQFTQSINAIKNLKCDTLVILLPSQYLTNSLYKYGKDLDRKVFPISHGIIFKNIFMFDKIYFYLRLIKQALIIYIKSIRARISLKNNKRALDTNICRLIISHVYEDSFDISNKYQDKFFGKLPEFLSENSNLIFFVHIHGNFSNVLKKIRNNSTHQLIPFEYLIHFRDILLGIIQISSGKIRLRDIKYDGLDITDIVKSEFKRSGIHLYHWLMYEGTRNLLKYFKFDSAYMTYENIAWENMFIMSLKQFSYNTKIIGYQHSVVPQSAAGMFIGKKEKEIKPLPDKLLTVGLETTAILRDYGNYPGSMIDTGCALRYEYLERIKQKKTQNTDYILLALEGISEVSDMVNYVLKYVNKLKDYNFIIRTHPALTWGNIQDNIKFDINRFSNVTLSRNTTLIDDLNQTDICIYWGSTVALEALSMGIPLIHYDIQSILSYDPLFRCNHLKWTLTNKDSLLRIIKTIKSLSNEEYTKQANLAKAYIKRYFYSVSEKNMSKFVYN